MKRAVSVSLGSSTRDKRIETTLLGEEIVIERIGTDGDMHKAMMLYKELDGKVDAFGMGGADMGVWVDGRWYTLYSVGSLLRYVNETPIVDGTGLKNTLEKRALPFIEEQIGDKIGERRVLMTVGSERWGMSKSFLNANYEIVFGDMMFALGLPVPLRKEAGIKTMAAVVMPLAGRLPFHWLYPTGEKQHKRTPKFGEYFNWASIVAGDCHYIRTYMPEDMTGKIILTNTTTPEDVDLFRKAGASYLVTTTPQLDGRSFGTNMMEAALVAVSGKKRTLSFGELDELIDKLEFKPQLTKLN